MNRGEPGARAGGQTDTAIHPATYQSLAGARIWTIHPLLGVLRGTNCRFSFWNRCGLTRKGSGDILPSISWRPPKEIARRAHPNGGER